MFCRVCMCVCARALFPESLTRKQVQVEPVGLKTGKTILLRILLSGLLFLVCQLSFCFFLRLLPLEFLLCVSVF